MGVRWLYAFSDESALARFALARGEGGREWAYQRWIGARLLDALGELKELGMVGEAGAGRGFSDIALSGLELGHEGLTSELHLAVRADDQLGGLGRLGDPDVAPQRGRSGRAERAPDHGHGLAGTDRTSGTTPPK